MRDSWRIGLHPLLTVIAIPTPRFGADHPIYAIRIPHHRVLHGSLESIFAQFPALVTLLQDEICLLRCGEFGR